MIWGENSAILAKLGKFTFNIWHFSANWECFRFIGKFFSQLGKNFVPETRPSFVWRKSPGLIILPFSLHVSCSSVAKQHGSMWCSVYCFIVEYDSFAILFLLKILVGFLL